MSDYNDENSEHYDGDYNGKPIEYEDGLHDLFKQKADLTEADKKLLAENQLPTDLANAKAKLDEIAEIPLNLAKRGAGLWNLWVKLNKWRWLVVNDIGVNAEVRFIKVEDNRDNQFIKFFDGLDRDNQDIYEIDYQDFSNFVFPFVNFSCAKFRGNVNFRYAFFQGDANFTHVIFLGNVYFEGVGFGSEAKISDVVFEGNVSFVRACFAKISFHMSCFKGLTDFSYALFGDDANLGDAIFYMDAIFVEAQFDQAANFERVIFLNNALFNMIVSKSYLSFTKSIFFHCMRLSDVSVLKGFTFKGANFLDGLELTNSKVEEYIDLNKAFFGKKDNFKLCGYQQHDEDIQKKYNQIPSIGYNSLHVPDFKGTEFKLAPNLSYTNIPLPPQPMIPREKGDGEVQSGWRHLVRFLGIDQRYIRIKDANAASKFRRLQELAAQGHNHHAEAKFFRAELLTKRGHETSGWREVFLINLFEKICE